MSNSPAVQVKRYMRLAPSNGSGDFSFTNGNPIIRFSVADTQAMLVGKEMRLCGTLKVYRTGTTNTNYNQAVNIDRIAGVQSFISSVSIGSRRYSANVLEVVHNYPRLAKQLYTNTHSAKGMRTTTFNEHGGVGQGRYSERDTNGFGTDATGATDRGLESARKSTLINNFDFALRLNTGLLMNDAIPLNLLGGLEITINLNSNFASIYGQDTADDVNYVVSKPYLITPLLYMSPQQIASAQGQKQGAFSFMSYQSLYSVIDSTDQSIVHRLNSKNLVSVLQNYIPVKFLNNKTYNGLACWNAGGIKSLEFHKDGVRFPLEYNLQTNKDNAVGSNDDEELQRVDLNPQILWNAQNGVRNVKDIKRSQIIPENLLGRSKDDGVYTTGISWDLVSGAGIAVQGTLTYDLRTKLEDPVNKDLVGGGGTPTLNHSNQTPFAQYSFYLSKQNLLINKGSGIMVM